MVQNSTNKFSTNLDAMYKLGDTTQWLRPIGHHGWTSCWNLYYCGFCCEHHTVLNFIVSFYKCNNNLKGEKCIHWDLNLELLTPKADATIELQFVHVAADHCKKWQLIIWSYFTYILGLLIKCLWFTPGVPYLSDATANSCSENIKLAKEQ